jgi:hypothetical protein
MNMENYWKIFILQVIILEKLKRKEIGYTMKDDVIKNRDNIAFILLYCFV